MAFLRHFANGASVGVVELNERVTIGRSKDNAVCLDDATVSAEHAVVIERNGHYVIEDRASTNGVHYRGKRVAEHVFAPGDVITIGTHDFEFLLKLPDEFAKTLKIKKSWIPGIYYTQ